MLELEHQDDEELAAWGAYPCLPQSVKLLDGTTVVVRPVRGDDTGRLQAFFDRLSPDTLYARYLHYRRGLSESEAASLTSGDPRTQIALVATHGQEIIALAHYTVFAGQDRTCAEPAIVVEDRYQRRGLGTLMLKYLAAIAYAEGIRTFHVAVHATNAQVLRFIEASRLPATKRLEAGVWDVRIELAPRDPCHVAD